MGLAQLVQLMLAKDQVRQTALAGVYGTGAARTAADVSQGPGETDGSGWCLWDWRSLDSRC